MSEVEEAPPEMASPAQPGPFLPNSKTLEWISYAAQETLNYQKSIKESMDSAISVSLTRLSEILSTASAHSQLTFESLRGAVSDLRVYEDMAVGKVKEGVHVAASHPWIAGGVTVGLGALALKRPRRFLYYNTLRLFVSEEAMLSQADGKVKELRHSISLLTAESEKLQKRALSAEEELNRGRKKLRQAGKQIQGVIRSAYKIERKAAGLKDILRELPGRQASKFRTQVSSFASEVKQERNALTKEVTKISNYGISV